MKLAQYRIAGGGGDITSMKDITIPATKILTTNNKVVQCLMITTINLVVHYLTITTFN